MKKIQVTFECDTIDAALLTAFWEIICYNYDEDTELDVALHHVDYLHNRLLEGLFYVGKEQLYYSGKMTFGVTDLLGEKSVKELEEWWEKRQENK